jgi:hypothetical protein
VFSVLVHNQCSDFELVSPVYFGHNVIWHIPPDQKVDTNATTRANFRRDIDKIEFASALMYKLQRKKRLRSNDQSNADGTSTEDTLTSLQLLVICGSEFGYVFSTRVLLVKHSKTITWSEDTLEKLHSMHSALLNDDEITDTWLLDDVTVLMTTSKLGEERRTVEITISEETRKDGTVEPLWVSSNT